MFYSSVYESLGWEREDWQDLIVGSLFFFGAWFLKLEFRRDSVCGEVSSLLKMMKICEQVSDITLLSPGAPGHNCKLFAEFLFLFFSYSSNSNKVCKSLEPSLSYYSGALRQGPMLKFETKQYRKKITP